MFLCRDTVRVTSAIHSFFGTVSSDQYQFKTSIEVTQLAHEINQAQVEALGPQTVGLINTNQLRESCIPPESRGAFLESFGLPLNCRLVADKNGNLVLGDVQLLCASAVRVPSSTSTISLGLFSQRDCAVRIAHAISLGWPVLLSGPRSCGMEFYGWNDNSASSMNPFDCAYSKKILIWCLLQLFCSGKASIVRYLAKLSEANLYEITLTETIDATELLGTFEPENLEMIENTLEVCIVSICDKLSALVEILYDERDRERTNHSEDLTELVSDSFSILKRRKFENAAVCKWLKKVESLVNFSENCCRGKAQCHLELIANILKELERYSVAAEHLVSLISSATSGPSQQPGGSSVMTFRWVDSQLLQSIERGDWVILRHAQYASPAVLDRLNSLLEPNGTAPEVRNASHRKLVIYSVLQLSSSARLIHAIHQYHCNS